MLLKTVKNWDFAQHKLLSSENLSRRAEPQSPPPLSLKLAPSTFILLGNFVTLHFETAYIFPPCCIILKKKKK